MATLGKSTFPQNEHNCLDHLVPRSHTSTEPHGERYYQEWWECTKCGEKFNDEELPAMVLTDK